MSVRRFNLLSRVIVVAFAAGIVPVISILKGHMTDYAQYYLGGRMVWTGQSHALYPTPVGDGGRNLGYNDASIPHPDYEAQAKAIGDHPLRVYRYIHPPPLAVVLAPMGALSFDAAQIAWRLVMGACLAVALLCGGRIHEVLAGESRWTGGVMLIAALSPLTYRVLHVGNITPVVAAGLGVALVSLIDRRPLAGGVGMVLAGLAKGASIALVPVLMATRRWGVLAWTVGLSAALIGLSLVLLGGDVFATFFRDVAPSYRWPDALPHNQSLSGFVMRLADVDVMPDRWLAAIRVGGALAFGAVIFATIAQRRRLAENPTNAMAASAAALVTLMLTAPLTWEHYLYYLVPLWGWLVAEARRSRTAAAVAVLVIGLCWCPLAAIRGGHLPVPQWVLSHMFYAMVLMLALAWWRLVRPASEVSPA